MGLTITVRKDNEGDAVEVPQTINSTILVGTSYTTVTTRTDAGQDPVEHVQVVETTQKGYV